MSTPTLTPKQQTSAVVLPITGTVADVSSALPLGVYSAETDFLSGAVDQVSYTYKKLGGDVLDIEIPAVTVYANYEEAVLETTRYWCISQNNSTRSETKTKIYPYLFFTARAGCQTAS